MFKTLYIDGTFKTCPSLFTQLFSIHGLFNNFVVPLIYVLLSNKTTATYYQVFNILWETVSKLGSILNPQIIISDFESGLIEAVGMQYPNALHSGCHIHFTQAVWRKMQELGLSIAYMNSKTPEISEFVQLCMGLAFIPETDVNVQFDICVSFGY